MLQGWFSDRTATQLPVPVGTRISRCYRLICARCCQTHICRKLLRCLESAPPATAWNCGHVQPDQANAAIALPATLPAIDFAKAQQLAGKCLVLDDDIRVITAWRAMLGGWGVGRRYAAVAAQAIGHIDAGFSPDAIFATNGCDRQKANLKCFRRCCSAAAKPAEQWSAASSTHQGRGKLKMMGMWCCVNRWTAMNCAESWRLGCTSAERPRIMNNALVKQHGD